jgi:hypothetical protein
MLFGCAVSLRISCRGGVLAPNLASVSFLEAERGTYVSESEFKSYCWFKEVSIW